MSRSFSKSSHSKSTSKRRSGYRKPANKSASSNQSPVIELSIDALSYDGKGINRMDGRACFIEGALQGEKVKAQISAANNKRVEAKLIKVLEASDERVEPRCAVYQQCGGCDLQHLSHNAQIQHKQDVVQQMLSRSAGVESFHWLAPITNSQGIGYSYRRKVRLACYYDPSLKRLSVGFRAAKSKKIVAVSECQIVNDQLSQLLQQVYAFVDELHSLVSKPNHLSAIAHIECVADENSQSVCFRLVKPLADGLESHFIHWAEKHAVNLWFKVANGALTQVKGKESYSLLGDGSKLAYTPEDFLQVNAEVNKQMIDQTLNLLELSASDSVLDLFSGLGNFSIPAARKASSVKAIEAIDVMVEKSKENAQLNGLTNFSADAHDLFDETSLSYLDDKVDKVILDPPRAGAELIVKHMARTAAKKIAYVSCNPQALARDTKELIAQGYQLESLTLLDMFPQTSHIETLAVFKEC